MLKRRTQPQFEWLHFCRTPDSKSSGIVPLLTGLPLLPWSHQTLQTRRRSDRNRRMHGIEFLDASYASNPGHENGKFLPNLQRIEFSIWKASSQ